MRECLVVSLLIFAGCISSPSSQPSDVGSEKDAGSEIGEDAPNNGSKPLIVSVENPTGAELTEVPLFIDIPQLTAEDYLMRMDNITLKTERVSQTGYWVLIPSLGVDGVEFSVSATPVENGVGDSMWAEFEAVFHFDDGTVDSTPNARNGSVDIGTTTGVFGQSANFQTFTEIEVDGYEGMNVNAGALSVEFWVVAESAGRLLDLRGSCVGPVFSFSSADRFGSQFDADEVCNADPDLQSARVNGPLDPNEWTHFVLTFDRDRGDMSAIVNGEVVETMPLPVELILQEVVETIEIGGTSPDPFMGTLDELRISRQIRDLDWYAYQYAMGINTLYEVRDAE